MVIHDSKSLSSIDKIMSPCLQLVHANGNVRLSTRTKLDTKLHLFSKHHHTHIQRNNEKHPNASKPANHKQDQTRIRTPNLNHRLPLGTTVLKFQNVCCDLTSPWQFHHPPRLDAWQKRRRHKLLAQLGVDRTLGQKTS